VSNAIARGTILTAPDKDEAFAKLMPQTQKFITQMLTASQQKSDAGGEGRKAAQVESQDQDPDSKGYAGP